jgi:hypothetical protein
MAGKELSKSKARTKSMRASISKLQENHRIVVLRALVSTMVLEIT